MANSLAGGFIRNTYTGDNGPHHAIYPIKFSAEPTPGVEPSLDQKDTTSILATVGFAEFLAVLRPFFNTATKFGLSEIYKVDAETEERTFIYGWDAAVTGSAIAANIELSMATLTYKTIGGGGLKIVMMEGITLPNIKFYPPYTVDSVEADLTAYITSGDTIIIGRDNTYPFAPITFGCKTSDALRAKAGL
jgi:hypothetical protein